MKLLFIFLDGVGLGAPDPAHNPFARSFMPNLEALLQGKKLVAGSTPMETERATLLALDATLGIPGVPQSATGQSVLLTGRNVPAEIHEHYGPKPNPPIAQILQEGNLFISLTQAGLKAGLLNAYPDGYFEGIGSGKRLYSAIPLAVTSAGLPLKTATDYNQGTAISADLTGQGWRERLGYPDCPVYSPEDAGRLLNNLASQHDFSFFEYWLSDYTGHAQDMEQAGQLLTTLDEVLAGLMASWDDQEGLILITSDHGNLEDLDTRRHTLNPVPALLVGAPALRTEFTRDLEDLAGIAPAILRFFGV